MKKLLPITVICFLAFGRGYAQYVTIPDPNFAAWLNTYYPGCMIAGNKLDTTCTAIVNETTLSCGGQGIADLTGIQYFHSLQYLSCTSGSLTTLPPLPNSTTELNCSFNKLTSLPDLPLGLHSLECQSNKLTVLPALPLSIETLYCNENLLTVLPTLPHSLKEISCYTNPLTGLPALPSSLLSLNCSSTDMVTIPSLPSGCLLFYCQNTKITSLPALPASLRVLYCDQDAIVLPAILPDSLQQLSCGSTSITSLPPLPAGLTLLLCAGNNLTVMPALPATLLKLDCSYNRIATLPLLPAGVYSLDCSYNPITILSVLPDSLMTFNCSYDSLQFLPPLPVLHLSEVNCSHNQLTSMPALPNSLSLVNCSNNQLTSFSNFPDSLTNLDCSSNTQLACLPELKRMDYLNFSNTAITCLPNYGNVSYSWPALSSVPLCGIFNAGGCSVFWNISGKIFNNDNGNCTPDTTDIMRRNIKVQLYRTGILQQQVYTEEQGVYSFITTAPGTYITQVDTSQLPFTVSCPDSSYYTSRVSSTDSFWHNENFVLKCRTQGFDLGVWTIIRDIMSGPARPTAVIKILNFAGDLAEMYGTHCAVGIGGQVMATFSGPVKFAGAAPGALAPIVSGNTLTWNIVDFGTVNDSTAFNMLFAIDTFAVPGTDICFTLTVAPAIPGDYNPGNNTSAYCLRVVNSQDPNEKEVYPSGNTYTSQQWLTYTIHFQNTGTAPAQHIYIDDTLNSNLDISSFQLLSYSHKVLAQVLPGGIARFNFANINLPDSAADEPHSHGYVQYKIKLKDNLPLGTTITNTAYIYFDFNSAVITNTTLNTIMAEAPAAIPTVKSELQMNLYPNPAQNMVLISTDETAIGGHITITDISGREVMHLTLTNNQQQITTNQFARGIYFVKLNDTQGRSGVKKLVLE